MEGNPKAQSKKTWIVVGILLVALIAAAAGFYRYGQSKSVTELDAPTVTEAAQGADGVRVAWTGVKNAGSYWVFKRDVRGYWAFLDSVGSKTLSYLDEEGTEDICQYSVRARFESQLTGEILSDFSNAVTVQKEGFTLELAAPHVEAERTESGVTLTWNAIPYSTSYRTYSREPGGDWSLLKAVGPSTLTYTDEGADGGYEYSVRACSMLTGETVLSPYSNATQAFTSGAGGVEAAEATAESES